MNRRWTPMDADNLRMWNYVLHLCSSACICGFIFFCLTCGCSPPQARQPRGHFGPTEPMADVVDQINRNNAALPTLRATGNFEANVVDQGKKRFVNGDVTVLYRRPAEVRLVGKKDIAGQIFDAASNGDQYWLIVKGEVDTMWHGAVANLNRVDPKEIPIRPDLLVEVLGLDEVNRSFLDPPVPTMRFNNDADAYMFNFNVRLPDRWAVQKEVWYDRQTKLPRLILLFDENGRVVVRTYLSNHQPVGNDTASGGGGGADAPKVATRYQVFFPDTGTTLRIDLDNLALQGGKPPAPNDRTFAFPSNPGVSRQIDLDEQARL
jgi:hypothetical protein